MKLQIRVDDNGTIIETAFKTFGCGSAQASSSLASEWIKGKTLDEVLEIRNTYLVFVLYSSFLFILFVSFILFRKLHRIGSGTLRRLDV